jgi:hypothetical protein
MTIAALYISVALALTGRVQAYAWCKRQLSKKPLAPVAIYRPRHANLRAMMTSYTEHDEGFNLRIA